MRTLLLSLIAVFLILCFEGKSKVGQFKQVDYVARQLCINTDTKLDGNTLDYYLENEYNNGLGLLNYNFNVENCFFSNSKLFLIQKIIYEQNNLIEIDKKSYQVDITKVPKDQLETEIFIRLNSKLLLNELNQSELEKVKSILQFKPKNYKEWYNSIRLILILGKHYETLHETQKAFTTLLYGIHLIEISGKREKLKGLRDELVNDLTILFSKEESFEDYLESEKQLAELLTPRYKASFRGSMREAYIQEDYAKMGFANNYFSLLSVAETKPITKRDSMILFINWANYYMMCDNESKYTEYDKKTLQQFPRASCEMKYFTVLMSVLSSKLPESELAIYSDLLDYVDNCPSKIQNYVAFKRYQTLNKNNNNKSRRKSMNNLIQEAELALEIFSGRSTLHLQDYFLSNLSKMHMLYNHGEVVDEDLVEIIINRFYKVRALDLHRQKIFSNPLTGVKGQNARKKIHKSLLELNSFKNLVDFKDPIYEELFSVYVLEEENVRDTRFISEKISLEKLGACLNNKIILSFFRGSENYIVYKLENQELTLFRFETIKIDSILANAYHKIINKSEPSFAVDELFKTLHLDKSNQDLVVISDGILVNFPLELVFTEVRNIYHFSTFFEFINTTALTISSKEIDIVSYSSHETLSSEEKFDFPELENGLKECKEIASVLNTSNNLTTGHKFKKETILSAKKKMLHLSSHAKSNTNNRRDNYILTKDTDPKLYGFELYEADRLPEVVVLSACESGIGLHAYGAGVQTLSRAFLDNGTKTVIKTLWKVNEIATKKFMIEMYTNWVEGMSLYDALEKTKDRFENDDEYCAPYYWAGFVLEGNPNVYLETTPQ